MATRTWDGGGADDLWSTAGNWSSDTVPTGSDTVVFDATSDDPCTIDNLGSWTGGPVSIASGYDGTITQNTGVNFTCTTFAMGDDQAVFTCHAAATFTSTTFSVTAGTFNQGGAFVCTTFGCTSTGIFVGSSATMSTTAVTFGNSGTIVATSGIWTLAGSWTQSGSTTTFTHNSGTINITAASTFNDARSAFNKCNITTTAAAVTISASTTFPLGATPTTTLTTQTLTVAGIVTWSGLWTHTGSLTTNNGSTLTGTSTPTLAINQSMTINATTTITNAIGTITANGAISGTFTDTGNALSGSVWVVAKTGAVTFTVAASTSIAMGNNPTITGAIAATGTISGTGTLTQSFTSSVVINGGVVAIASTSVISGFSAIVITDGTFQTVAAATIPSDLNVSITLTSNAGAQTFFGGTKTYGTLAVVISSTFGLTIRDNSTFAAITRSGAGSGILSFGTTGAASSNTITTFTDNDGAANHTVLFLSGSTQTIANFVVAGAATKLVTLRAITPGTPWTLTTASGAKTADYVVIQDSTVDASPTWTAGSNSANAGGNTNWLFTAASAGGGGGGANIRGGGAFASKGGRRFP